jgi:hypothetical protein
MAFEPGFGAVAELISVRQELQRRVLLSQWDTHLQGAIRSFVATDARSCFSRARVDPGPLVSHDPAVAVQYLKV